MSKKKYLTEKELVAEFVQYLVEVQGLEKDEAIFGATGFPDPYELCYMKEEWVKNCEIDGEKVEVCRCWTDFQMMRTFDNSRPFRFYTYTFIPEGFGNTVGEYQAAKKLYRLNKSGRCRP